MVNKMEQINRKHIKFGEANRKYNQTRPQYLARKLLSRDGSTVLDMGSGLGEFSAILKEHKYRVVCVDGNEQFVEETEKRGFESYCCDFEKDKLPFNNDAFDGVVCLEVIEHIME